jgi:crotonobetainyl-CoA:carnitine CoA-transferase CaiB-like acyl-CoA transferase
MSSPLTGYTVVDLSSGIAGAYASKMLADGGADVVKVEAPEGDPLRRWSASGATIEPGQDGALFSFLACSKRSVVADTAVTADVEMVERLLASADAVVWSRGSAVAELKSLSPQELHRRYPHLIVTAITPFGSMVRGETGPPPSSPCKHGLAGPSVSGAARRTVRRYTSAARWGTGSPAPTPRP